MSGARRVALLVAYRGDAFQGFQRQPGFRTVQEELESAWSAVTGESAVVHGSGRTDSGVHGWGQVVHLSTFHDLPLAKVRPALNAWLPPELAVRAAVEPGPGFHARASAIAKHYVYRLATGPVRPVLLRGLVAWERTPPDLAAMRAAAPHLVGRRDWSAMAAAGRTTKTSVRTVRALHVMPARGGLVFHVRGEGFLYRQVRNMVGTLLEVGRGRRAPEWVGHVVASGDRKRAGATAPAEGLCLWRVHYAEDPFAGVPGAASRLYPLAAGAPNRPPRDPAS